jgi:hypothetical protein
MDAPRYLFKRIVRDAPAALRASAYLSVSIVALVSFAVLMPSLEYQHVRGPEVSTWDAWISGPMTADDVSRIDERSDIERTIPVLTLAMDAVRGPRTGAERSVSQGTVTAMAYRHASELADGPYPDSLLLSGRAPAQGEWACDWSVARRFGLRVGDEVTTRAVLPGSSLALSGRLAGIYGPTGLLKDSIVLPATPDLVDAVAADQGVSWTDVFVHTADPHGLVEEIVSGTDAERLVAVARPSLGAEARTRLLREVGPFLRSAATWVAIAGFVALALWQQSTRLLRRRREHAILTALGMSRRRLVTLDALEQSARLGLASIVGLLGALILFQTAYGMYVPSGVVAGVVATIGITVAASIAIGALVVGRYLGRRSLATTLAREAT